MKNIDKKTLVYMALTLIVGIVLGVTFFGGSDKSKVDTVAEQAEVKTQIWTCSMHPQIRKNEPGDCPICGMDLIPLESEESSVDVNAIRMSATALQLADVQTTLVGSNSMVKQLKMNGKVQEDERLRFTQSSHIPGRIEKLMVNFTGEYVSKNEVIAYVYSPLLVTAQEELFEAQKIKDLQPALFQAAQEKLKNWKLSQEQIQAILKKGETEEVFPILANVSGYVASKKVNVGDYIKEGQTLYEISNLSKVWVMLDVYETELQWIKKGDMVRYTIASIPGETFEGKVSYIDPTIDAKSRVAKARLEADNAGMKLKPEMFLSATISSSVNVGANSLSVPKSAVMWTGTRSIVYVKSDTENSTEFMLREIELGANLGDSYEVKSGLSNGEEVVVNGTFSVDAAAQLAGKSSMMNPKKPIKEESETPVQKVELGEKGKSALAPLYKSYFEMKVALSEDDFDGAKTVGIALKENVDKVKMAAFEGESHLAWMKYAKRLSK
ncbi:MAG: Cu(I)/Ag(I) efflux system membrane fusion protein, partial [Flavobacteriales bacterium]